MHGEAGSEDQWAVLGDPIQRGRILAVPPLALVAEGTLDSLDMETQRPVLLGEEVGGIELRSNFALFALRYVLFGVCGLRFAVGVVEECDVGLTDVGLTSPVSSNAAVQLGDFP